MRPGQKLSVPNFIRILDACVKNSDPDNNLPDLETKLNAGEELRFAVWHPILPNDSTQAGFSFYIGDGTIEVSYGPKTAEFVRRNCSDSTYYMRHK